VARGSGSVCPRQRLEAPACVESGLAIPNGQNPTALGAALCVVGFEMTHPLRLPAPADASSFPARGLFYTRRCGVSARSRGKTLWKRLRLFQAEDAFVRNLTLITGFSTICALASFFFLKSARQACLISIPEILIALAFRTTDPRTSEPALPTAWSEALGGVGEPEA